MYYAKEKKLRMNEIHDIHVFTSYIQRSMSKLLSGHSQLIVKPTCLAYKTGLKESAMQLDSILFID